MNSLSILPFSAYHTGRYDNAMKSFDVFTESYADKSKMVPEWKKYYKLEAVEVSRNALKEAADDPAKNPAVFNAMGAVGEPVQYAKSDGNVT